MYWIKVCIGLTNLFQKIKATNRHLSPPSFTGIDDSDNKLSGNTGLRKATISDIINAKSEMKTYASYRVLHALEYGKIFDAVIDGELPEYIRSLKNKSKAECL